MKTSSTVITRVCRINAFRALAALGLMVRAMALGFAFQTESPEAPTARSMLDLVESGSATLENVPPSLYYLSTGDYERALAELDVETNGQLPWLEGYLRSLIGFTSGMTSRRTERFLIFTAPAEDFLAEYAAEALERSAGRIEALLGHRTKAPVRVEIYPDEESFSAASTLTPEILERSGAIGICKFHRLMILSPRSLPLGYRWMDALSHEYLHLVINEMTATKAELWFHEGTARYFETAYRMDPPEYLSPGQQTKLRHAAAGDDWISFERMSPSLVYLKNQDEVGLAFAEVAYAVSQLVEQKGTRKFSGFLASLGRKPFWESFRKTFGFSRAEFETHLRESVSRESWPDVRGAMDDRIFFQSMEESAFIGADAQGKSRLGDRMRIRGNYEAALIEYEKALRMEPDNAILLLKAARTLLALNNPAAALEKLEKAVRMNPNYATPRLELAKLVPPEQALVHLKEANAINPFDPEVHALMAGVYERLGAAVEADREREIARRLGN